MAKHINDLNNDCLRILFNYFTDFNDHLSLANCCQRWSDILNEKYFRYKYLLCSSEADEETAVLHIDRPHNFVSFNVNRLLRNVIVCEVNFIHYRATSPSNYPAIAIKNARVKGIVCDKYCYDLTMFNCFPNAEMLVCTSLMHNPREPLNLSGLKQLYIRKGSLKILSEYESSLQNLERLHINQRQHLEPFTGKMLNKLKILEYDTDMDPTGNDYYDGFDLIDKCPVLECAFITNRTKKVKVNKWITNRHLRTLVIEQKGQNVHQERFPYIDILSKFPNLINLAIRNSNDINDATAYAIVSTLSKVELLDFRGCEFVTAGVVELVNGVSRPFGRTIKVELGMRLVGAQWMDLGFKEKICSGFDFMRHCFNKPFDTLPLLLVPEDENLPN